MITTAISRNKRSLWPYAIAGHFFIMICAMGVFVTWAVRQKMDLVRSDYYEDEILFQKQINALNRTRAFSSELTVAYDHQRHALRLRLPSSHAGAPFTGKAHLYRPSDARLDERIDLKPARDGTQTINTIRLAPGLWKVRLDWTAGGETFAFEQSIVIGG